MSRLDFVVYSDGRVNVSKNLTLAADIASEKRDGTNPTTLQSHFHLEFNQVDSANEALNILIAAHYLEMSGNPQESGASGVEKLVSAIVEAQRQPSD